MDITTIALTCTEREYTDIEKARLRKAIAEYDGWVDVEMRGSGYQICVIGRSPKTQEFTYVPNSIANPAETVRMLKVLTLKGWVLGWGEESTFFFTSPSGNFDTKICEKLMPAVAEAYVSMIETL